MRKPAPPSLVVSLEPAGFFALRTPLLPFDELVAFGRDLRAPAAARDALDAAVAADRAELRRRLRAVVTRPEVREALFIASPSLEESLPSWLDAPDSERGQKVERTLVRYFARMAARPTPFGLFAGCSTGTLGDATRLTLPERAAYRRHTRLDNDYLATLTDALERDPALRPRLTFRPNTSLYRLGVRWRYVEAQLLAKERMRAYRLVEVEPDEALDATLARAAGGATLDALAQALTADDVTLAEARDYVHELVDAQLLVAELAPQVTGAEPIHDLVAQLAPLAPPLAAALDEVRAALAALDASPIGAPPSAYRDVAGRLQALPVEPALTRLFQVDLVKPGGEATLGAEPVAELTRALTLLAKLTPRAGDGELGRWKEAFRARYQSQTVPLAEVLDEDLGIGFARSDAPSSDASPLLDGLVFPAHAADDAPALRGLARMLFARIEAATRAGADEVALGEADLAPFFAAEPAPLPTSFSALATLAAASPEALARGDFRLWLHGVSGPSGANLLGRFCHGDEALTARVRAHLRDEEAERPDALFAELVHLPEGRIGNIMLRPLLREHELTFLGRSGAPPERQLRLDDLLVSVENGRVVLRSRRLGREIVPRLTSAHAFSSRRNLGVYRFLCALQGQDGAPPRFDLGALDALDRLPRLTLGKVVLRPRRWRLAAAELAPLGEAKSAPERFARVRALRDRHGLPRWVAVADSDNVLPVDLDNVLAVDTFVQLVKERTQLTLTELSAEAGLCAHGPEGAFTHELVIPMLARRPAAARASSRPVEPRLPRALPPGSEWLYLKLYCGPGTADRILRDTVAPLCAELRAAGAVDDWFFIRYSDPDFHLRLRFCGDRERLLREAAPRLDRALARDIEARLAWKLQHDTYDRELERYGGDAGMALCERIFAADSDAVLAILAARDAGAGADTRWRLTLRGIDQLLDDLGLTLADKQALVSAQRDGFAREHRVDAAFERQLGERFRRERLALESLLDRGGDAGSALAAGLDAFAARSRRITPVAAQLREHAAAGRLGVSLLELGGSLIHMHANRMLRGAARAQELVLYDFLTRLYQGQLARARAR